MAEGCTDCEEMGEDLAGVLKVVAEELGVDLRELRSGFAVVEVAQDSPFHLSATTSAHSYQIYAFCGNKDRWELLPTVTKI